jgi:tRNA1Val (adenine37-N6)-methyltransferase
MTPNLAPADDVTRDCLLRGRVTLFQPRRGFRSSLDPVLLAGFVAPPYGRFLDLGCGTGALAFLLLARDAQATGVGVEVQPRLAGLVERGIAANDVAARFHLALADVRRGGWRTGDGFDAGFDLVATNPPFQPIGCGALPPDDERAIAHHEVKLTLGEWLDQAALAVRSDGRIATVFPAGRLGELLAGLSVRGFSATRLRPVYPRPGQGATRILCEARRHGERPRQAAFEPPLFVHADDGEGYSAEVRTFLGEELDAAAELEETR